VSLARALAAAADHADELVEVAKLGAEAYRAVTAWVNGSGAEPEALAKLPDLTRMRLAQARLEALAESAADD
jgi:hypothetical protein